MKELRIRTVLTLGVLLLSVTGMNVSAQGPPPPEPAIITAINNVTGSGNTPIISSTGNSLYVDFSKIQNENAEVILYNVMGQQLSKEMFNGSTMYIKSLAGIQSGYVIVQVNCHRQVFTKKIYITN